LICVSLNSKTSFKWLRRADAEICAPLLDAALSRKSTLFVVRLRQKRFNIQSSPHDCRSKKIPPNPNRLDAARINTTACQAENYPKIRLTFSF
jgi:hypothetical protein